MKLYAAILVAVLVLVITSLPAYPQYQTFDERMRSIADGIPVIDAKLALLIRDVEVENWAAVDFHNKKLVEEIKKKFPDESWLVSHYEMFEAWTEWDNLRLTWERRRKVDASQSSVAEGTIRVRSANTIKIQKETIAAWKKTHAKVLELDEIKGLLAYSVKLSKLWSGWTDKVEKLNKAINELRKY